MIKNVIKEIGIALMLLIAISLILSIIFYQYIPSNKTVPIAVKAYMLPEDIQEELKETIDQKQENIVKTLYINDEDLNKYETKNNYNKGKSNPFADYSTNEENNQQSNDNANVKQNGNTATSNNTQKEDTTRNEVYVSTSGKN